MPPRASYFTLVLGALASCHSPGQPPAQVATSQSQSSLPATRGCGSGTVTGTLVTRRCIGPVPPDSQPSFKQPRVQGDTAPALSSSPSTSGCDPDTTKGILVTRWCIGPIPLDSPLSFVAAHFPGYHAGTAYLEETKIPTWEFAIAGVRAIAAQVNDSLDLSVPAWNWMVFGTSAFLAKGVTIPATWGELRNHWHGSAFVRMDELGAHAEVCDLPGLTFFLDFDYSRANADSMPAQDVPAAAAISQVGIYPTEKDTTCH